MLVRENHLFGSTRSKPSQSSVPAGLTLPSDSGVRFQCQAGSSFVLHRPIEITAVIGEVKSEQNHSYDDTCYLNRRNVGALLPEEFTIEVKNCLPNETR